MKKLLVFTYLLVFAAIAIAQTETATLSGRVADPTGAVIVDALCTITQIETGVSRTTQTNGTGIYAFPNLKPGNYRLSVEKEGFQKITKTGIVLHVQDSVAENFDLKVGSASESMTVVAEGSTVQTSSSVGTSISPQFVDQLPMNGRSFLALLTLAPGVVPASGDAHEFNINGQRSQSNAFSIDGMSANIQGASAPASVGVYGLGNTPGLTISGTTQSLATIDELQEFNIQTAGYGAQEGRQSGGQIAFVTKSGTDQFHGSLYDYFRNEDLDANNWFSNHTVPSTPRQKLRQNDAGGTFGGPIWRHKTFFFAALEFDPLLQPTINTFTVPTQAYRNSVAAAVMQFVNLAPLPNGAISADGLSGTYTQNGDTQSFTDAATLKLDQNVGSRLTMFARYHRTPSRSSGPGILTFGDQYTYTQTGTYGATYTVRPRMVSDFRLNYSRNSSGGLSGWGVRSGVTPLADSAIMPPGRTLQNSEVALHIAESSFQSNLGTLGVSQTSIGHQWQATENLSFVEGKHQLDVGVDWRTITAFVPAGFPALTQLSITNGATAAAQASSGTGSPSFVAQVHWASFYIADTWKIKPRLTLDLGLRWEIEPPPSTTSGPHPFAALNFDPNNPSVATLAPDGTPLWKTRYNNFAPRVGAAYHLFTGAGRDTVLRGSFGLFYDMGLGNPISAFTSAPFTFTSATINGTYPGILANPTLLPVLNVQPPYPRIDLFDPNMKMPYTINWTFGVQQSLGQNQSLSATYVGNRGERLLMRTSQSTTANPIVTATGSINQTSNQAKSWYDALQVQYIRRLSHGLQAIVNYTWSHSIDTVSNDATALAGVTAIAPGKFFNVNLNRASSDFDVRHAFTAGVTYRIPAPFGNRALKAVTDGWSLDPLVRAYSAKPVNITYTYSLTGQTSLTVYPNLVPGQPTWISNPTVPRGQQINSAAFAWPVFSSGTQLAQGNAGRNSVRGFPETQADLAVRRDFKLNDRFSLQFSGEMFNIFNHPNFTDPFANLGSVTNGVVSRISPTVFGTSSQMLSSGSAFGGANALPIYAFGGQRDVQLALKLMF